MKVIKRAKENSSDEYNLVTKAVSGDEAAFEQIVRSYEKAVFATACHYTRRREDAYDITQEIFIKIYRFLPKFRFESSLSTWIYRLTVNTLLDFCRKNGREEKNFPLYSSGDGEEDEKNGDINEGIPDTNPESAPEEALLKKEKSEIVRNAIGMLPEKYRQVLILRDIQGLSYKETGEILGIGEDNVRSGIYKARRKLKEILEKISG